MMRKFYQWTLVVLAGVAFSSCSLIGGEGEPTANYKLSDLQGLWQRNNSREFFRFTEEESDEPGYLLGLEWDLDDDKTEQDRWDAREELGHPGNGWFKYQFESKGDLHEIHLQDNQGAEEPKEYIVSKLTETDLEYYEKGKKNWKYSFTRVVETKNE